MYDFISAYHFGDSMHVFWHVPEVVSAATAHGHIPLDVAAPTLKIRR